MVNASLQTWFAATINFAAAVAFLYIGKRLERRSLGGVEIAFIVAAILVGGKSLHFSPTAAACGYVAGFVASAFGFLGLLKAYTEQQHSNTKKLNPFDRGT